VITARFLERKREEYCAFRYEIERLERDVEGYASAAYEGSGDRRYGLV
jgi:hypothetical protein